MDENELNPTGLEGSADEDLKIIEDYLAGEEEEQDQGRSYGHRCDRQGKRKRQER